ncbi:MAG: hypothetical protein ABIF77_11760, partial [bacterium]
MRGEKSGSPTGDGSGITLSFRWLGIILVSLLVGLVVIYPEPLLRGEVFLSPDAANSDAFDLVGRTALAAGDYPLWNP